MTGSMWIRWCDRLLFIGSVAALVLIVLAAVAPPAQARAWVSVGVPCCGYYPGYYGGFGYYPPPPPYPYAPPPAYYPQPEAYPGAAAPSAYTPDAYTPGQPAPAYPPVAATPGAMAAPVATGAPSITYTNKPAFINAAGQTCREYKTTDVAAGRDVFGTACKAADGQWRVVN